MSKTRLTSAPPLGRPVGELLFDAAGALYGIERNLEQCSWRIGAAAAADLFQQLQCLLISDELCDGDLNWSADDLIDQAAALQIEIEAVLNDCAEFATALHQKQLVNVETAVRAALELLEEASDRCEAACG